jgi:hypothetical protein
MEMLEDAPKRYRSEDKRHPVHGRFEEAGIIERVEPGSSNELNQVLMEQYQFKLTKRFQENVWPCLGKPACRGATYQARCVSQAQIFC